MLIAAFTLAAGAANTYVPDSAGRATAWKRASQMLNICWTPKDTIPSMIETKVGLNGYKPDTLYRGLPYSQVRELNKYVGYDVSFTTYLTAVNNPYSMLYTEIVSEKRNRSAYGTMYHGGVAAPYMGVDCSCFVGWALGFPLPYKTFQYNSLNEVGFLDLIVPRGEPYATKESLDTLQPMDILWKTDHVILISDVIRNAAGTIDSIQLSQSTTNGMHALTITERKSFDEFYEYFHGLQISAEGCIYRYPHLAADTIYTPSPAVFVDGETSVPYNFNNDICNYRGDSCSYRLGEMIMVNYNLKEVKPWKAVRLCDEHDKEIATVEVDTAKHFLDLTPYVYAQGKYKACMVGDAGEVSRYTYFEVLDPEVRIVNEDGTRYLTFSTDCGTPIYAESCGSTWSPIRTPTFTEEEQRSGKIELGKVVYPKDMSNKHVFVKVHYQGEYGRVISAPFHITGDALLNAQGARPIGALYLGVSEQGTRASAKNYLVLPEGLGEVTFPNYSIGAEQYSWQAMGTTIYGPTSTPDDLTLGLIGDTAGAVMPMPLVCADTLSYALADSVISTHGSISDAHHTYYLGNHIPMRTPFTDSTFAFNPGNTYWSNILRPYRPVTVKGFAEYFRQPLRAYQLKDVNVLIYVADDEPFSLAPLQLRICAATSNYDGSMLKASPEPLAVWTMPDTTRFVTSSQFDATGAHYVLHFTGDTLKVDEPIVLELVLDETSKETAQFTVCSTQQEEMSPLCEQSAFVLVASNETEFLYPAYKSTKQRKSAVVCGIPVDSTYTRTRSLCFYVNIAYDKSKSAITDVQADEPAGTGKATRYFDLYGREVAPDAKGIVITDDHRKLLNR